MQEELLYESMNMQAMTAHSFDEVLQKGYRLLGHTIIRHNQSGIFGIQCETIPLRIQLKRFAFSKSQKRILRKNADLRIETGPFQLTFEKNSLFNLHCSRFLDNNQPASIESFLTDQSHRLPTVGREIRVYEGDRLVALSICHLGESAVNATYCFFDPRYSARSLGTFTLLKEIEMAIEEEKLYFYLGYTHSLPSQFDYKLNFKGLEKLNWRTMRWRPTPRVTATNWLEFWQGESMDQWHGVEFGPKAG